MQSLNIIYIEDDDEDFSFFTETIETLKVSGSLTRGNNCTSVFSLLEQHKNTHLIFLDINLPLKSGKECLRELKANQHYKNIPVIILSGSNHPIDVDEMYESGAHYHIVKPSTHTNYVAALEIITQLNWNMEQPIPLRENFLIEYA